MSILQGDKNLTLYLRLKKQCSPRLAIVTNLVIEPTVFPVPKNRKQTIIALALDNLH